jgi:hypothetical protein
MRYDIPVVTGFKNLVRPVHVRIKWQKSNLWPVIAGELPIIIHLQWPKKGRPPSFSCHASHQCVNDLPAPSQDEL